MSPDTLHYLLQGLQNVSWQSLVMVGIGLLLIWLAVSRQYEPLLLLPIGVIIIHHHPASLLALVVRAQPFLLSICLSRHP